MKKLFTPDSPHIDLGLNGVEIFSNGSGSHHELRKLHQRVDLIRMATKKVGGIYLYSNQIGCDGYLSIILFYFLLRKFIYKFKLRSRVYYDGCCMIAMNGEIVAQGSQFSLMDCEVVTATLDLDLVRTLRAAFVSRSLQATSTTIDFVRIFLNIRLTQSHQFMFTPQHDLIAPATPIQVKFHTAEEEICYGPACWLWDYLRRSGLQGFFLPLSGGLDSSSTATIVYAMCHLLMNSIQNNDPIVIADIKRIIGTENYPPTSANDLLHKLLFTCFMSTSQSTPQSRSRAGQLAKIIGCSHYDVDIDSIVNSFLYVFSTIFPGKQPRFKVNGGTPSENRALENIQARTRMVFSYLLAQLLPWIHGKTGSLLVLSSSNVDEALRGYLTKYDCSSADLNPIGGVCKADLRRFMFWAKTKFSISVLSDILSSPPSAELEPQDPNQSSPTDSQKIDPLTVPTQDMCISYEEISKFGRFRKVYNCGPLSMFENFVFDWQHYSPVTVAAKVKTFFHFYGINRHKMTVITPAYHAESYSPDDNRYDLRPFLYPNWALQFRCIDSAVETLNRRSILSNSSRL